VPDTTETVPKGAVPPAEETITPEPPTAPEAPATPEAPTPPELPETEAGTTPPEIPPEPQQQEETPAQEPPGGTDSLAIPESAARGAGPVDFLQGRWRSQSGLVDDSGRKLDLFYEFDKAGRGRSIVRRADGVECQTPAEARMEGGRLEVQELQDLRCADGQLFEKTRTTCQRDAAGRTQCRGAYEGGRGFDVQIDRAKP
jgi:hypothetical protein